MENDMKDLKPIDEMISFWEEGGEYLSCPKCGFILSKETTIDDSNIYDVITCGKCSESWEVHGKLIGYKEYEEAEEKVGELIEH